jgi:hypothetical protein
MDSFSQPQPLPSESLDEVRAQVQALEDQHRGNVLPRACPRARRR